MTFHVKQGGAWKDGEVWVREGGTWKKAEVWVKQGGTWKQVTQSVAFTPDGGTSSGSPVVINANDFSSVQVVISCTESAVWTWTRSPNIGTCNVASGNSATSITMTLTTAPVSGGTRSTTYTLSATAGGITRYWTVNLTAEAL